MLSKTGPLTKPVKNGLASDRPLPAAGKEPRQPKFWLEPATSGELSGGTAKVAKNKNVIL
jgi:hypothetical protein